VQEDVAEVSTSAAHERKQLRSEVSRLRGSIEAA